MNLILFRLLLQIFFNNSLKFLNKLTKRLINQIISIKQIHLLLQITIIYFKTLDLILKKIIKTKKIPIIMLSSKIISLMNSATHLDLMLEKKKISKKII
jgi:hypothetical protein